MPGAQRSPTKLSYLYETCLRGAFGADYPLYSLPVYQSKVGDATWKASLYILSKLAPFKNALRLV